MVFLGSKPVVEWLGYDGHWYLVRTERGRYAVKLWQLGADGGADDITLEARKAQRI